MKTSYFFQYFQPTSKENPPFLTYLLSIYSSMESRREIFGQLLSNSVIDGRKAWFCLKKIPDALLTSGSYLSWLRGLNIGRTRDVLDLLSLGKNISDLMQRIQTEILSKPQESGKNG